MWLLACSPAFRPPLQHRFRVRVTLRQCTSMCSSTLPTHVYRTLQVNSEEKRQALGLHRRRRWPMLLCVTT